METVHKPKWHYDTPNLERAVPSQPTMIEREHEPIMPMQPNWIANKMQWIYVHTQSILYALLIFRIPTRTMPNTKIYISSLCARKWWKYQNAMDIIGVCVRWIVNGVKDTMGPFWILCQFFGKPHQMCSAFVCGCACACWYLSEDHENATPLCTKKLLHQYGQSTLS